MSYDRVIDALRNHYDRTSSLRESSGRAAWKLQVRERFLQRLHSEGKTTLLEIGAGPGHDSLFFQKQGFTVISADLSPAMVELCRRKGLDARVMDFLSLDFAEQSFQAVYALNCLLHVPPAVLPDALARIRALLCPTGLLNVITYGGLDREGWYVEGGYPEPRYLSYYSRENLLKAFTPGFRLETIEEIATGEKERPLAYSLILRKPGSG